MSEFQEIMKRWREMCVHRPFTGRIYPCKGCPLEHNPVCGELEAATDEEIQEAENSILNWEDKDK